MEHNSEKPRQAYQRSTIRDVAEKAGVSVTTASRALNDTGRMSAETRERVREVAALLDYRPSSLARGLVQQRSFTIGLLTNDTYGRFTLPVAAGLSAAMADKGVSVFLSAGEYEPERLLINLRAMEEKRVDGLVITGKRIDRGLPIELPPLGMPVVYVYSAAPEGAISFVPDDFNAARRAVRHLADLGRRRIAHVTGPEGFEAARIRAEGWRAALADAGMAPHGDVVFGNWSEAHGFEAAHALAGGPQRPDAIFCGNDQIARGAIDAFTLMGIRVPDDVAIVGYDNWEVFAQATRPPLTSMDMCLPDLGRSAGLALLDMIGGKPVEPGIRKRPFELVVRQSSGADRSAG